VFPSSAPSQRDHAVDVITAGERPPNPKDLIESDQMQELLSRATEKYDLVVIDTPPTTVVSDAVPLLTQVSGVIAVVRLGKSTRAAAESLREQLDYFEAPTLGVVVNMTGKSQPLYGYGEVGEAKPAKDKAASAKKGSSKASSPKKRSRKAASAKKAASKAPAKKASAKKEAASKASAKKDASKASAAKKKSSRKASSAKKGSRKASSAKGSPERRGVPHWFYNRLSVTGDPAPLGAFVERVKGEMTANSNAPVPLDFGRHVPTPELVVAPHGREADSDRKTASDDGWNLWRTKHWGTKVNAMWAERKGEPGEGAVAYLFASDGSPPREWLARASEAHPHLSFALEFVAEFCEEAGGARWQGGIIVETWEVDPDDADWVEYDDDDAADG